MTDVSYRGGGRWTILHNARDYAKAVWKQPGLTFAHRGDWSEYCTFCKLDLEEQVIWSDDIGGEG